MLYHKKGSLHKNHWHEENMGTFTVKTWHKEGSSFPILIDQNPETPIQCYYAILNQSFGKHLAEPVPSTHEWANFDKLHWKCSGEDLEEYRYKELPENVITEFESAKGAASEKMKQFDPESDKFKIFEYFIHALEDGEEHLRFFVNQKLWYVVNWGMHSDPKYVLMLPNPPYHNEEETGEEDFVTKYQDSILPDSDNIERGTDGYEHESSDDVEMSDDLEAEVPPFSPNNVTSGYETSSVEKNSNNGWYKWIIFLILLALLLYFLWGYLFPAAVSAPESNQAKSEQSTNDERRHDSNPLNRDVSPSEQDTGNIDKPLTENAPGVRSGKDNKSETLSSDGTSMKSGPEETNTGEGGEKGQNSESNNGNSGSRPENITPQDSESQHSPTHPEQNRFSEPKELDQKNRKNYGNIQPKDSEDLSIEGDEQSQELIGEVYRYEGENATVYYLYDMRSGKSFLLDYESTETGNAETPKVKGSIEI